jgi:hypothetical protein
VKRIVDDDAVAEAFVLDYLAHLVQRPAEKIQSALLFIGVPGTGKNILANVFIEMLGRRNTKTITANYLSSEFTGWVDGAVLTVVDEVVSDNSRATAARIKSLITNETVRVNEKGIPAYDIRNRNHFVLLSNDRDAAIIDPDDRRFFVWRSSAAPASASYYSQLCRWLAGGGYARVLHLLQTRDISRFNAYVRPPRTRSRAEIVGYGRPNSEVYLANAFDAGEAPFDHDLIVINHVCEYLLEVRRMRLMPKPLGHFLRSVGAMELGQKRIGNAKPHVWAIRDAERWMNAPEDEIAEAYRRPASAATDPPRSASMPLRRLRAINDL